jgi:hypothetical protein
MSDQKKWTGLFLKESLPEVMWYQDKVYYMFGNIF